MPRKSCLLFIAIFAALATVVVAQDRPHTPAPGNPERKAILDALRVPVEKKLKRKVVFKVDELKVLDGWAFVRGVPQQPGGKPMDYSGTPYQQQIEDGAFDDGISALLRLKGGKWTVVIYDIGATDVVWVDWGEKYKAPPEIFNQGVWTGCLNFVGFYKSHWGTFPHLQILAIEELLTGKATAQYPRLNAATFKRAERKRREQGEQIGLF